MTPARFRWGLLLIFFGVLFLLINIGTLNHNIWGDLIFYSPVILIAIGIEKIFTRTRLQMVSYASSVALVAAGMYLALNSGIGGKETDFFSDTEGRIQSEGDVQTLNAVVRLDEEDLTVQNYTDDIAEWNIKRFTRKPVVDFSKSGGQGTIRFDNRKGGMWGRIVKVDIEEKSDWYVTFSRVIPLSFDCTGDRSDVHLDFSETPLRKLKIDIADGRIYVVLGKNEPLVDIEAAGVDAKLRLRIPNDAGLRISGIDDPDYLRTIGLVERGSDFVTGGYDTQANKINVKLDDRFNSLTLEFY
jgi:hypothetical protein